MSEKNATTIRRGILYCRMSTAKQSESLEQQIDWAIGAAKQHGVTINISVDGLTSAKSNGEVEHIDLYFDSGISGSDMFRPGLLAFLKRADHDPQISHVFYWNRDRLARPIEPVAALVIEKKIRRRGKAIVTQKGVLAPLGRNESDIGGDLSSLVEWDGSGQERFKIARNAIRGAKMAADRGLPGGGRAVYGFIRVLCDVKNRKIISTEVEGLRSENRDLKMARYPGNTEEDKKRLDIVRRIAHEYHIGIGGFRTIANRLNEEGIPSPGIAQKRKNKAVSGRWSSNTVSSILMQPLYMGKTAWGKSSEGAAYRFDKNAEDGTRELTDHEIISDSKGRKIYKRDHGDWVWADVPVPYEPIVDPLIWYSNFEKIRARGVKMGSRGVPKSTDPNRYPLPVFCGLCGVRMMGTQIREYSSRQRAHKANGKNVEGTPQLTYTCATYKKPGGNKECYHTSVSRDEVVRFALHAIGNLFGTKAEKTALAKTIRATLKQRSANAVPQNTEDLTAQLNAEDAVRKEAYRAKLMATGLEKADAEALYKESALRTEQLRKKLEQVTRASAFGGSDVEDEVAATLECLSELHLYINEISDDRLFEAFSRLGVSMKVDFEVTATAKRRVAKPVSVTLSFDSPQIDEKHGVNQPLVESSPGEGEDSSPKANRGGGI